MNDTPHTMAAEAYITRLAERGIDYVFANAGTDFAPIVESLARNPGTGNKMPRFMIVPHENVAMAMAHGYYRIAGKPAAVMVHVTVGTANALCGLMNASRDNVPVLLAAGRTPLTESGSIASRNRSIHWGQESFDQGGMVREYVKWDYELRSGQPVEAVVDRALDIAMTEPRGPVYLTLPREVIANPVVATRRDTVRPLGASAPEPSRRAIEEAARLLGKAEFPLIITSSVGRSPEAVTELAALAEDFALPVVQAEARDFNISTEHPMNLGFEPAALLPKADVIVVLDSVVPWIPRAERPAQGRQDHPHLRRSARQPFSVPRDRGRPADRRRSLRRARAAARKPGRRDEGEGGRRAPQDDRAAARGERSQAQEAASTPSRTRRRSIRPGSRIASTR